MRIVNGNHQSLHDEQKPVVSGRRKTQKVKKRGKTEGDSPAAPHAQQVSVQLVVLVENGINSRKKAVNQPVDDPKHECSPFCLYI